jgi:hypothetical protein
MLQLEYAEQQRSTDYWLRKSDVYSIGHGRGSTLHSEEGEM